jgi:hypothetical protein
MTIDLSAGGKLTVNPHVTPEKVVKMSEMIKDAKKGGFEGEKARIALKETLSTSDAPFSFAHTINLRNLPQYEEQVPNFAPIVQTQTVVDFNIATFYNLTFNQAGLEFGEDNNGQRIAPRVGELDTYQYAFGYTQESTGVAVQKRGFKVGLSLEQAVNDVYGTINRLPGDMLNVGVKTEEYVVHRALVNGVTNTQQLAAGTDYVTGTTVAANNDLTPAAIRVALAQLAARVDSNGYRIPLASSYYLVVPLGQADAINWMIDQARALATIQDGNLVYRKAGSDPLGRIAGIIEDEWITDLDSWYMVPAAGTTDRPALLQLELAGYTSPEVYVDNFSGSPVAGGASGSPFKAFSFNNDSVDFKFRQFTNAAVFAANLIIWSDGSGS